MLYERLGLCGPGEGPKLIDEHITTLDGRQPVNPSGGLCSRGHPVGATGLLQICELVWQMRGEAGARQIEKRPKVTMAQNQGGLLLGSGFRRLWLHDFEILRPNVQKRGYDVSKKRKEVVKSIEEAVALIKDGQMVAVGGFGADNHPMAIVREMIRTRGRKISPSSPPRPRASRSIF